MERTTLTSREKIGLLLLYFNLVPIVCMEAAMFASFFGHDWDLPRNEVPILGTVLRIYWLAAVGLFPVTVPLGVWFLWRRVFSWWVLVPVVAMIPYALFLAYVVMWFFMNDAKFH